MNQYEETLGYALKRRRIVDGYAKNDYALRLGIPLDIYSRMECDDDQVPIAYWNKVWQAIHVTSVVVQSVYGYARTIDSFNQESSGRIVEDYDEPRIPYRFLI